MSTAVEEEVELSPEPPFTKKDKILFGLVLVGLGVMAFLTYTFGFWASLIIFCFLGTSLSVWEIVSAVKNRRRPRHRR